MQSLDDIARAITEIGPTERQTLMDRLAQLNADADSNGQSQSKIQAIEDAMNDELFLLICAKSWKTSATLKLRRPLHNGETLERLGFFYNLVCLNSSTP